MEGREPRSSHQQSIKPDAVEPFTAAGLDTARWEAARTTLSAFADQVPCVPLFTEDDAYAVGQGFAFESPRIASLDPANGDWVFLLKSTV